MQIFKTALFCAGLATLAAPALAADFSDPTWPCIQRKVERLSIGLMWTGPLPETHPEGALKTEVDELAAALSLRRVDLDDARGRVSAFADAHGRDEALMGQVFARVFDTLSHRRTRIMKGIADYSESQIALSGRIEEARQQMDSLMAASEPDYDAVDKLEEQLDWDERIFTDRQKSLTYVCESPVLLEKRLYALAQMLQEAGRS